jgi:hypothetical protein
MKIVIEYDVDAENTIHPVPSRGFFVDGEKKAEMHRYALSSYYRFQGCKDDCRIPLMIAERAA